MIVAVLLMEGIVIVILVDEVFLMFALAVTTARSVQLPVPVWGGLIILTASFFFESQQRTEPTECTGKNVPYLLLRTSTYNYETQRISEWKYDKP